MKNIRIFQILVLLIFFASATTTDRSFSLSIGGVEDQLKSICQSMPDSFGDYDMALIVLDQSISESIGVLRNMFHHPFSESSLNSSKNPSLFYSPSSIVSTGMNVSYKNFCKYWRVHLRTNEIFANESIQNNGKVLDKLKLLVNLPSGRNLSAEVNLTLSNLQTRPSSLWYPLIGNPFGSAGYQLMCNRSADDFVVLVHVADRSFVQGAISGFRIGCSNGVDATYFVDLLEKSNSSPKMSLDQTDNLVSSSNCSHFPATKIFANMNHSQLPAPIGLKLGCSGNNPAMDWKGISALNAPEFYLCPKGSFIKGFKASYNPTDGILDGLAPVCLDIPIVIKLTDVPVTVSRSDPYINMKRIIQDFRVARFNTGVVVFTIKWNSSLSDVSIQSQMRSNSSIKDWSEFPSNGTRAISYEEISLGYLWLKVDPLVPNMKISNLNLNVSVTSNYFDEGMVFNASADIQILWADSSDYSKSTFALPIENGSNVSIIIGTVIATIALLLAIAALLKHRLRRHLFIKKIVKLQSKSLNSTKTDLVGGVKDAEPTAANANAIAAPSLTRKEYNKNERNSLAQTFTSESYIKYDGSWGQKKSNSVDEKSPAGSTLVEESKRNLQRLPGYSDTIQPRKTRLSIQHDDNVSIKLAKIADKRRKSNASNSATWHERTTDSSRGHTVTVSPGADGIISIPGYLRVKPSDLIVKDLIAKGASSDVYKAVFNTTGNSGSGSGAENYAIAFPNDLEYAIKMMKHPDPSFFKFEVALMSSIPISPYVVSLVAYIESPNGLVMKLYKGSLSNYIYDEKIEIDAKSVLKISLDIATGLRHLHGYGIVHFDVKPKNIFVNFPEPGQFQCAIGDFGNAKLVGTDISSLKVVQGLQLPANSGVTMAYCAPEILKSFMSDGVISCQEQHKKGDVYSYAITIFETLKRGKAWNNFDQEELQAALDRGESPSIPEALLTASLSSNEISFLLGQIQKCWSIDPDKRPDFSSLLSDKFQ